MKKGWKYIIAAGVIIGISFLYAHVDKQIPVFDRLADTSVYGNMSELTNGLVVRQEFVCERSVLDGVSIKCAIYGRDLTSTYHYQILDAKSGDVLRDGSVDASEIKDGKFYKIDFERIDDCEDQEFVFLFEAEDAEPGNALTIYNVPKNGEKEKLKLNADEFYTNTLAMRTVSYIFDWETFVGTTFALAYLYAFMLVLYKFFR